MSIKSITEVVKLLGDIQVYLNSLNSVSIQSTNNLFDLLKSDDWPLAVPHELICGNLESDKLDRASGILDVMLGSEIENRRFLDFGCGEGHVALRAAEFCAKSVGYDLISSDSGMWEVDGEKSLLTTDFSKVELNVPFDFVLLYDVLDHSDDPVGLLKKVASVCTPNTKVHVRCHALCSRHGGHLYKKLNKAWAGVIFTQEELFEIDSSYELDASQKVILPIKTYKDWFLQAGFFVMSEEVVRGDIEPFFSKTPEIRDRLISIFEPFTKSKDFPSWQLSQQFNDFVLMIK